MTTDKQKSNSWLMMQKLTKAQKLMDEVLTAITLRPLHPLWDEVIRATAEGNKSLRRALNALDDVQAHNKAKESEKI